MSIKSIVRELNGFGAKSVCKLQRKTRSYGRARGAHIAPEAELCDKPSPESLPGQSFWADLPPELLHDIIQLVEASETAWPARRDVVACASVCRSWRRTTKEIVKTPEECGCLTFPISLKQPGPRDALIQCYIKRETATSTYRLILGLSPALSGDRSKLLLTAKKIRKATGTDFRISFYGNDFCPTTSAFVGRLRSNFMGTKFTIYDSQPANDAIEVNCKPQRNIRSVQVYPQVPARNYNVASVTYELNILRTRGPRRMRCTMHSIPLSAVQEGGTAPTPTAFNSFRHEEMPPSSVSEVKRSVSEVSSSGIADPSEPILSRRDPLVLKNKAPRWHEQLQCWCLNFKGRVTVASVKNFQLVAAVEPGQNISAEEQEKVILQFGKIGKDIFSMDYRYPLSAFQAFAICLSSFDTKPACE